VIVEFDRALSAAEMAELRAAHSLALDQYLPRWAYLERISPQTLVRLHADPRVRDLRPYDPAPQERLGSRDAAEFRATLFDDADPGAVAGAVAALGADEVVVLDDRAAGGRARIRFALNARDRVAEIAALDEVVSVEATSPMKRDGTPAAVPDAQPADITALWARGLHGEGQVIGILDDGPPDIAHCFFADAAPNVPGPGHRKLLAVRNATKRRARRHPTFVAGIAAGDDRDRPGADERRGSAWAARLVCGNRNDLRESSTVIAELTAAMGSGAFIHTNSWHFDTTHGSHTPALYSQDAADVDQFTFLNEDHLVLGSAGNHGEEQGPPGTAKNAVCVGASKVDPTAPQFGDGNPGPTADGRHKPDLMALGCDIQSARLGTGCGTGRFGVRARCATSFATPRAAAAAALARQYFTEGFHPSGTRRPRDAMTPSGALLKAVLINSTIALTGIPERPSNDAGWGVLQLDRTLAFADLTRRLAVWDVRHGVGPKTGEVRTHKLDVSPSMTELRVSLVWSDPPPGAIPAAGVMVNHLGLRVTGPDGSSHVGGDDAEPVQMITIVAPAAGQWQLVVEATEVVNGRPGQGYALVAVTDGA
jgi:hypothetical protein